MAKRKSVGRPRQEPEPGERAQLSFRVTAELKRRLDAAADRTGRSQSQEAEFRLERSFDHQDLLSEALTLAYGRKLAGIIMALGHVMDGAARSVHMPLDPFDKNWLEEPECFERAYQAACTLLTAVRPQGTPPKPTSSDLGWAFTNDFIVAMHGHKPDYADTEQAERIKRLLGPIGDRMTPEYDRANPLRLAIAVLTASSDLETFRKTNSFPFQPEPVAELLERRLKDYLAPDWRWRKEVKREEPNTTEQKDLEAAILPFRRSA
jgi:hypothetical protein